MVSCMYKLTCELVVEVDNERLSCPVVGGEKREKTKKDSQRRAETGTMKIKMKLSKGREMPQHILSTHNFLPLSCTVEN